ncbi:MAG: hypothetical protein V2A69_14025 [Pseudomonadota bacterium]
MAWCYVYPVFQRKACPERPSFFQSRFKAFLIEDNSYLIYLLWETGRYRNHEIGAVFVITYSAVSQRVTVMKERIGKDKEFGKRCWHLKSQFKM